MGLEVPGILCYGSSGFFKNQRKGNIVVSSERIVCLFAALAAIAALSAEPSFDPVPPPAIAALKVVRGKTISTGMVFLNGKLLPGPYVVSRHGTVIKVNREQVTGQIVPWVQFTTAATAAKHSTPAPAPAPAAPTPPQPADDLFDDASAVPSKPATAAAPAPPPPVPAGDYVDGPRSKALLKRINDYRTDVDRTLRGNGMFFFGASHQPVRVDPRLAKELSGMLPDALRDASSARELHDMFRRKGITYLPEAVCAELMRDRALYMKVKSRIREIQEEQSFRKLLGGAQ